MHSDFLKVVVSAVGRHLRLVSDLYKTYFNVVHVHRQLECIFYLRS